MIAPAVLFMLGIASSSTSLGAAGACGYVEFRPVGKPRYSGTTAYERIRATVMFADGHSESEIVPYPWVYPDAERTDPWSATNLRRSSMTVLFQPPPPDFARAGLPPLIVYIDKHTMLDGYSTLQECPTAPPEGRLLVEIPAALDARTFSHRTASGTLPPASVDDCVWFTNRAPIAADRIVFELRYADAGGRTIGEPLRIEARGRFEPGVEIDSPRAEFARAQAHTETFCRTRPRAVLDAARNGTLAVTRLGILSIHYADGTSWRVPEAPLPNTIPR